MSEEGSGDETSRVTLSDEDQAQTKCSNKHKCHICEKVFSYRKVLAKHMQTHSAKHKQLSLNCHICGKIFYGECSKQSLTRHLRIHSDESSKDEERKFKCDHCGRAFHRKKSLDYHTNSFHTEEKDKEKATCPVCGKMFAIGYIDRHIEVHAAVPERHECPQCGKILFSKKTLRIHIERGHAIEGEYSYKCETCGNNYKSKVSLQEHIKKIHSNDKRPVFDCKFCDKKFLYKPSLVEHERHHTGEKPIFCQHCHESFRLKAQLKRHEQIHIGGKPYKCGTCSKTFGFLSNLKTHMLIHSDNFRFSCPNAPNCPKRFKQKVHSQLHFKNCRAEKPTVSDNEIEDDSESNQSSRHVKGNLGRRWPTTQPAQHFDESRIIWKECTVSIKRTDFIERAIWLGYSSLTHVSRLDKKKGRKTGGWVNTAQIGAGTGPKKRKIQ